MPKLYYVDIIIRASKEKAMTDDKCPAYNILRVKLTQKQLGGMCRLDEIFCPEHLLELAAVAQGQTPKKEN